jgi:hypothetical protein
MSNEDLHAGCQRDFVVAVRSDWGGGCRGSTTVRVRHIQRQFSFIIVLDDGGVGCIAGWRGLAPVNMNGISTGNGIDGIK